VIAGIGVDVMQIGRLEAALERTPERAARLFTTAERSWAGMCVAVVVAESVVRAERVPPHDEEPERRA